MAGEALKHFAFIVPEDVSIEEEKKDAEGNADGTISVPTMKVQGQIATLLCFLCRRACWEGSEGAGELQNLNIKGFSNGAMTWSCI